MGSFCRVCDLYYEECICTPALDKILEAIRPAKARQEIRDYIHRVNVQHKTQVRELGKLPSENYALRESRKELQAKLDAVTIAYNAQRELMEKDNLREAKHREEVRQKRSCDGCYYSFVPGGYCPKCGRRG